MTVATELEYEARVWVDGDEISLPFRVYADDSYAIGENLHDVAWRQANDVMRLFPARYCHDVRVRLYPLTTDDCSDDYDPEPVGEGVAY